MVGPEARTGALVTQFQTLSFLQVRSGVEMEARSLREVGIFSWLSHSAKPQHVQTRGSN